MSCTALPFPSLPWTPGAHPLEKKKVVPGASALTLEFQPGFEDPNVCTRGHHIYVVSGRLSLELDTETIEIGAGEGCVLDPGTRHRAKNLGPTAVTLFVVSTDG